MCSIVVEELYFGAFHSVDAFLKPYQTLAFGAAAARIAAQIRSALALIGQPIGPFDVQIAAIALEHGLTLVTHNTSEFGRVPGLNLVDWELP